jgi:hypothetical protein
MRQRQCAAALGKPGASATRGNRNPNIEIRNKSELPKKKIQNGKGFCFEFG